jgi:hypothetical protein
MSITAMKQALEALEMFDGQHTAPGATMRFTKTITSLRQAIEQSEKMEPVAVVNSTISGHIDWLCVVFPKQGTKLYTTPQPQREWVGLTPDEVFGIADQHPVEGFDPDIMAYTRAIEQTLKEKNT